MIHSMLCPFINDDFLGTSRCEVNMSRHSDSTNITRFLFNLSARSRVGIGTQKRCSLVLLKYCQLPLEVCIASSIEVVIVNSCDCLMLLVCSVPFSLWTIPLLSWA